MHPIVRSNLSKIKFAMGLTPQIRRVSNYKQYLPNNYKAVCILSNDFEMAWASRFTKSNPQPLSKAIEDGYATRKCAPIILQLCEQYQIPITWATVGHLFLKSCQTVDGFKHPEIKRLPYFENDFWKFQSGDWFDADPMSNVVDEPAWYAPDLITSIIESSVKHEIGCHTFSHIDCRDTVCSSEIFNSELTACQSAATPFGIKLTSFVHPGHTIGNLKQLRNAGFLCFRTDYCDTLGIPIWHSKEGIWEFEGSGQIEQRKYWSYEYHAQRYIAILKRAISSHTVCNLWFHPSFRDLNFLEVVFTRLFDFLNKNRHNIWITTMSEYATFLNQRGLNE